ncbi:MAG: endo alpha-1,4 polygalactosaminidase [Aminipila sp.]
MKKMFIAILIILVSSLSIVSSLQHFSKNEPYGVFIGLDSQDTQKIRGYKTVVIDAEYFTIADISKLHSQNNNMVYTYLNVGSLESFRNFYSEFESITLGEYESWPDERWVDISKPKWKKHIINTAKELSLKGVDGFFLDNIDVYYYFKNPEIYQGLLSIIKDLNDLHKPIIINGGNVFVEEALKNSDLEGLITGINQENVFTSINFKDGTFHPQNVKTKQYFLNYLKLCKDFGLQVYLTEYGHNDTTEKEIHKYCNQKNYNYYISSSIQLN